MRYTYRHIGILTISLIVASCSFSKKQANNSHDKNMNPNVKIVVLDPGHFHASLLQKNPLASVNDTIRVYAPEGAEVKQYLNDINSYNQRAENPTSWKEEIYIGGDYLSRMLSDRQGDVVVLALPGFRNSTTCRKQPEKNKLYSGSYQSRIQCAFRQAFGH